MNYTEKYHLPQWEETDRVLRTDFNQMCADMEAGLNGVAAQAAKADPAAVSAAADAAAAAQSTANQAVSKADAARAVADNAYCPSKKPFAVGSYIGDAVTGRVVSVGFPPRFVMILGETIDNATRYGMAGEGITSHFITLNSSGFTFTSTFSNLNALNNKGSRYTYIAFP